MWPIYPKVQSEMGFYRKSYILEEQFQQITAIHTIHGDILLVFVC